MVVDIAERIAKHFPIERMPISIEVVEGATGAWMSSDEPKAIAIVRLIVWDVGEELMSVRDMKEQELTMGAPALYEDEARVANFFAALGDVIGELANGGVETFEGLMPYDLMCTSPLKLKRARTRDDFVGALWAKSRLGQYLSPSAPR